MCVVPAAEVGTLAPIGAPLFLDPAVYSPSSMEAAGVYDVYLLKKGKTGAEKKAEPQFHAPTIFVAPRTSQGQMSLSFAMGGVGGGSGSGDGGGGKKVTSVEETVEALKKYMPETKTAAELMTRIDEDIARFADERDQLRYIGNAVRIIDANTTTFFKFPAADLLKVVHHIAGIADKMTDYATARERQAIYDVDEALIFRSLFRVADRLEIELLNSEQLNHDLSRRIADVHFAFARKGDYKSVFGNSRSRRTVERTLAPVVLATLNAVKRYGSLLLPEDVVKANKFLEEVKTRHGLPFDSRSWALSTISEQISANISSLIPDDRTQNVVTSGFDLLWNDATRGIYSFSPFIFRQIAADFASNGFQSLAEQYANKATELQTIAKRLGLLE